MKKWLLSLICVLFMSSCFANPIDENGEPLNTQHEIFSSDGFIEICDRAEIMYKAAALTKMKPIFISGSSKEYAMIVYIDLKTEDSLILRVRNNIGCVVGEGSQMILRFPEGIQEI